MFNTLLVAVVRKNDPSLSLAGVLKSEHSVKVCISLCALISKMQGWRWITAGATADNRNSAFTPAAAPKTNLSSRVRASVCVRRREKEHICISVCVHSAHAFAGIYIYISESADD